MLDGRPHARRLHTSHVGDCDAGGQQGVLGETLETAAVERSANDVDGRAEDDVDPFRPCLAPERRCQLFDEPLVPRGAEPDWGRQRCGWIVRVETRAAHAGRAVGKHHRPQADRALAVEHPRVRAGQQADLLLQR